MALKAVSEVVLPEMRNNLVRKKERLNYADYTNRREFSDMLHLQERITEVERLVKGD